MTPIALITAHLLAFHGLPSPPPHIKHSLSPPSSHLIVASRAPCSLSLYIHSCIDSCSTGVQMDPIIIEKIGAMNKYSKNRRQQQLPTLSIYLVAIFVICLLLTGPAWLPSFCSHLSFFFLTTLPDLVTAFLLSPKCLFVIGNLIVAFLVGESRLAPRRDEDRHSLVNEIHEEHLKRNMAMVAKATAAAVVVADHNASVEAVGKEVEVKEEEEEGEQEELHKRVEDFIARVKKQRKLEAKSFFDVDR